jgi:hypothetical protein
MFFQQVIIGKEQGGLTGESHVRVSSFYLVFKGSVLRE